MLPPAVNDPVNVKPEILGDVANTLFPVPVLSVSAEARFADDGVARNVATPVPKPEIPVDTGRPVAFVRVTEEGVPSAGVTSVGLVANTKAPEPVSSVTAEAKLADVGVARNVATPVPRPLTPVLIGKPVAFVRTPDAGVPSAGVVSVGLVSILFVKVCEPESVTTVESIAN